MVFLKICLVALISTVIAVETEKWTSLDSKLITAKEINDCIRVFQQIRERKVEEIENIIHEVPTGDFCASKQNGIYADPYKCNGMIKCIDRCAHKLSCKSPLLYNPWSHECDIPKNVDCVGRSPWTKLGETCYEVEDNGFGTVVLPRSGTVVAIKLTHINGSLLCQSSWFTDATKSFWGCDDEIATVVTNERDHVILPKRGKVNPSSKWSYKLPNQTSNSSYLILTDYSKSIRLEANEKLRVWYGEDLVKSLFTVAKGGKHCISVEAKIIG